MSPSLALCKEKKETEAVPVVAGNTSIKVAIETEAYRSCRETSHFRVRARVVEEWIEKQVQIKIEEQNWTATNAAKEIKTIWALIEKCISQRDLRYHVLN